MTQSSYTIDNKAGALVRADLNTLAAAIQSGNSGSTAPTDTRGGMVWVDTSTTPATLRIRNVADNAWIAVGTLGTTFAVAGLTLATQAEAETGANNTALMTPLRTAQAFDAREKQIGVGQTWQTPSRTGSSTSYQNTTGRPIQVSVRGAGNFQVSVNNSTWVTIAAEDGSDLCDCQAVIPNNHYYRLTGAGGTFWRELR
jgi:hypothetical protein